MKYVERNKAGAIKGVYNRLQPGQAEEALADDHPDIRDYHAAGEAEAALPSPIEARLALLEEKTGGPPKPSAIMAKRVAMARR